MKRVKRIVSCAAAVLLVTAMATSQVAMAEWNPNTAVHIDPKSIEPATIAFGTHLIHVSQVTDKLYELGLASAADAAQTVVYYKSELADGKWFNTTTASSLDDIAKYGSPIDDKRIAALLFTHHTKSDGITYDLRTGKPVNPYDLPAPYDVYEIEELRPLIKQHEYLHTVNTYLSARKTVASFLEGTKTIPTEHKLTKYDEQLDALFAYQTTMRGSKATKEQLDVIERGLEHLDATRRGKFLEVIDPQLKVLNEVMAGNEQTPKPDELLPAISESQTNVKNSIAKWKLKQIAEGGTVLNTYRYNYYSDLISAVTSGAGAATTDPLLANLVILKRIEGKEFIDIPAELAMLTNELTPAATAVYLQRVATGESADFKEAVKNEAEQAKLTAIATEKIAWLEASRTELEFFIVAMVERMEKQAALDFLDIRIEQAEEYYKLVPDDSFVNGAKGSVEAHIEFLKNLRNKIANDTSEEDEAEAKKDELEEEKEKAIDEGKLDDGNKIQDKIDDNNRRKDILDDNKNADLEKKIIDLEDKLQDADGDIADKIKDELEDAKGELEDGGAGDGKRVIDLKDEGQDAIDGGKNPIIDRVIDDLIDIAETNPGSAGPIIEKLKDEMEDKRDLKGDKSFGDQIEKAAEALKNLDLPPSINMDAVNKLFLDYDPTKHKLNAAIAGALGQAADIDNNKELDRLRNKWVEMIFRDGNPYTYIRINDSGNEYIPCKVLSYHTGMRSVWYQQQLMNTLTKSGTYYSFTVDATTVNRDKNGKKSEEMTIAAKWQDAMHIHESYTQKNFDAEAYYVADTKLGVMLSTEIKLILADTLKTLKGVS
ncbi:MAG: hypothetical protein RR424_04535 [Oscillospiraceae bacterium]